MAEEKKSTPGSMSIEVGGSTYEIYPAAPPAGADVAELEKLLQHNRTLLNECKNKYNKAYQGAANLFAQGKDAAANKKARGIDPSIVANACIARMNISKLVPLITMKGGKVFLTRAEQQPIGKHIAGMMKGLEKKAKGSKRKEHEKEAVNNNWIMWVTLLLIMLLVIALLKNIL